MKMKNAARLLILFCIFILIGPFHSAMAIINTKTPTNVVLTAGDTEKHYGYDLSFRAAVAEGATGTVTFKDGDTVLGTADLKYQFSNGVTYASFATKTLSVGYHDITAVYEGDDQYEGSASNVARVRIYVYAGIQLELSKTRVVYGEEVSFTATVTKSNKPGAPDPTGDVTFYVGDASGTAVGTVTLSNSKATYSTSTMEPISGSYGIWVKYTPDTGSSEFYNASGGVTNVKYLYVKKAKPTISLSFSENPTAGQAVTMTATLPSACTGKVTFDDGDWTTYGEVNVSDGKAVLKYTFNFGWHEVVASYSGDEHYEWCEDFEILQVNKGETTTNLTVDKNPALVGDTVVLTATVTSGAEGDVIFREGSRELATVALSGGKATHSITYAPSNIYILQHKYTAEYKGNFSYSGSTSTELTVKVDKKTSTVDLVSSDTIIKYGESVTFTATVTSGATGTVRFAEGSTIYKTVTISGGTATYTTSSLSAGEHTIKAIYYGDQLYASSSTQLTQTVSTLESSVTLSANKATTAYGEAVTFTAEVTSGATGTVTFKDGETTLGTVNLSGEKAIYQTSELSVGSHRITAAYGGNAAYAQSTSNELTQAVDKATTSTNLTSNLNPSESGDEVIFTAGVTGGATGTVTFKNGEATLGTATLSGGKATYKTSALTVGSHTLTAAYEGDANCTTSTSEVLTQTVNKIGTSTDLSSGLNPSEYGNEVTFTAEVTSGATGTVTFKDGDTTLGTANLSDGKATYKTSALSVGMHGFTAIYAGDETYAGSTSEVLTQTVSGLESSVTLSADKSSTEYGDEVTFTAEVTSGATGTVTYKDGDTTLGTANLSAGKATYKTSTLSVGTHGVTAVYGGDAAYGQSVSNELTQTVDKVTTSTDLTSDLNPAEYGNEVTFTAEVTSGATGTVTYKDGDTTLGTANLSDGKATCKTSALSVGTHGVTATYAGDTNHEVSTSEALTLMVNKIATSTDLTSSLNPAEYGNEVTFTAEAAKGATGTVTFKDGDTTLGHANLSDGKATCKTSALSVGTHTITAAYVGDAKYEASVSEALTQTISKITTNTDLTSSLNPAEYGNEVTFIAEAASGATGTVTFKDGGTTLGTANLSDGKATYKTSALSVGTHIITAAYVGDAKYEASASEALTQTVNKIPTTASVTSDKNPVSHGRMVTFTAEVTSGATGSVTFMDGKTVLKSVELMNGTASYATKELLVGSHEIVAVFEGDEYCLGSESAVLTQTIKAVEKKPGEDDEEEITTITVTVVTQYDEKEGETGQGSEEQSGEENDEPSAAFSAERIRDAIDEATTRTAKLDGKCEVEIVLMVEPVKEGASPRTIEIPHTACVEMVDCFDTVKVSAPLANVAFPRCIFAQLAELTDEVIALEIEEVDSGALPDEIGTLDVKIVSVGLQAEGMEGIELDGKFTVAVPYELRAVDCRDAFTIHMIDANGETRIIEDYWYDEAEDCVCFLTDRFATYAVQYE